MHYLHGMKSPETQGHLNENLPDLHLLEYVLLPLMMLYFLEKVPVIRIFHHYTISQHLVRGNGCLTTDCR